MREELGEDPSVLIGGCDFVEGVVVQLGGEGVREGALGECGPDWGPLAIFLGSPQ